MNSVKSIAVIACVAATAGCGGGGAGGSLGNISFPAAGSGPITQAELQRLEADALALENVFTEADVSFAAPSVSSATYDGLVGIDLTAATSLLGRVTLNADFSGGSIAGTAGDFSVMDDTSADVSSPIENLSGSIPITGGVITGSDMTANMNGSVTGASGTYTAATTLNGSFVDVSGASIVGGAVDGSLTLPDTSSITAFGAFLGTAR